MDASDIFERIFEREPKNNNNTVVPDLKNILHAALNSVDMIEENDSPSPNNMPLLSTTMVDASRVSRVDYYFSSSIREESIVDCTRHLNYREYKRQDSERSSTRVAQRGDFWKQLKSEFDIQKDDEQEEETEMFTPNNEFWENLQQTVRDIFKTRQEVTEEERDYPALSRDIWNDEGLGRKHITIIKHYNEIEKDDVRQKTGLDVFETKDELENNANTVSRDTLLESKNSSSIKHKSEISLENEIVQNISKRAALTVMKDDWNNTLIDGKIEQPKDNDNTSHDMRQGLGENKEALKKPVLTVSKDNWDNTVDEDSWSKTLIDSKDLVLIRHNSELTMDSSKERWQSTRLDSNSKDRMKRKRNEHTDRQKHRQATQEEIESNYELEESTEENRTENNKYGTKWNKDHEKRDINEQSMEEDTDTADDDRGPCKNINEDMRDENIDYDRGPNNKETWRQYIDRKTNEIAESKTTYKNLLEKYYQYNEAIQKCWESISWEKLDMNSEQYDPFKRDYSLCVVKEPCKLFAESSSQLSDEDRSLLRLDLANITFFDTAPVGTCNPRGCRRE